MPGHAAARLAACPAAAGVILGLMKPIDFSLAPSAEQVAQASDWLALGDYRVIRPLAARHSYSENPPPAKLITVAIIDTETTGTNPDSDQLIELGMVLVELCPQTGQGYRVITIFDELEDPGRPIPEESTRIHHITDAMVAGQRIDDKAVDALLAPVALVIAHNAGFDRIFVERRFPAFAGKPWACSWAEIPWAAEGIGSAKLEFLAYHFGFHYRGHRAVADCQALLEVLQQTLPASGTRAMQRLLDNARITDIQVSALGAPFATKDVLRARAYRWNAAKKVWARRVPKNALADEIEWIRSAVYDGQPFRLELEKLTAMNRYSQRPGPSEIISYA
jgi:DNA polymerase-3 subunit epsilon